MENNIVLEIAEVNSPEIAIEILYKAMEHGQKHGIFGLNDSTKIHQSLVFLVKYFQTLEQEKNEG